MGIWIGLAHVTPVAGNDALAGAIGAFVPVVALTSTQDEFVSLLTYSLESHGFDVVEIEDIETWEERTQRFPVDEQIQALVRSLKADNPIQFSTFQSYASES
jgi:hypothetical protein